MVLPLLVPSTMIRLAVIVQARLASTRFPRKVWELIEGRPMIEHVMERAAKVTGAVEHVLAVPDEERQAWTEWYQSKPRAGWWRVISGTMDDVLARFAFAARQVKADVILRVTGDCPLFAPEQADRVVEARESKGAEYASNIFSRSVPDGMDAEAFTIEGLERADREATGRFDREHVTPYLMRTAKPWACAPRPSRTFSGRDPKMSVDTPEDLARVRRIAHYLAPGEYSLAATLAAARAAGELNDPTP